MLVLSEHDVHAALSIEDCIEAVEKGMRDLAEGRYFQPLRMKAIPPSAKNRMVFMPALRLSEPALWGLKTIVVTPENAKRGLDSHQGAVLLHDGVTGELCAVIHAGAITAIRTAAASAVATRALARQDSQVISILGTGVQGRAHISAMRSVFAKAEMRIWSREYTKAQSLAGPNGARACETVEEACRDADIICTVTASPTPILALSMVRPGCHINAVGSSIASTREIGSDLMSKASLFVDRRESTLNESGDYLLAAREIGLGPDHIRAELGDVLADKAEGRRSAEEITLYKSLGIAVQDLVAAETAYCRAKEMGVGTKVEF